MATRLEVNKLYKKRMLERIATNNFMALERQSVARYLSKIARSDLHSLAVEQVRPRRILWASGSWLNLLCGTDDMQPGCTTQGTADSGDAVVVLQIATTTARAASTMPRA